MPPPRRPLHPRSERWNAASDARCAADHAAGIRSDREADPEGGAGSRVAATEAKARRELREEHQREIAALTAGQTERLGGQRELCKPTTTGLA